MSLHVHINSGILSDERKELYATLFEEFRTTLAFAGKCRREDGPKVAEMTQAWIKRYLEMGFGMAPYLHLFHIHLPMSVALLGGQDRLSGELVELQNDSIKKTHLRKTNRKNPALTLRNQLRVEYHERIERLQRLSSDKRKSKSRHPDFGKRLREKEKENRDQEDERRREATLALRNQYCNLTDKDLKERIYRQTGRRTLKRGRDALLSILWNLENGGSAGQ